MPTNRRLPVSSRHAFALAFDLGVRRDWLHSLLVPLLLQTPWFVLLGMLPSLTESRSHLFEVTLITAFLLIGQTFTWLLLSAMLRFRARSVFNAPAGSRPAPAGGHYRGALRRVPALFVTESLRNFSFSIGGLFLFVPALYLGFKLSMATEDVVLRGRGPIGALRHSFRITEGRWERWMEMIALSVVIVLGVWFAAALSYVAVYAALTSLHMQAPGPEPFGKAAFIVAFGILPIVQYAWTFFYLRLEDSELAGRAGAGVIVPPADSAAQSAWRGVSAPKLRLVELARDESGDDSHNP